MNLSRLLVAAAAVALVASPALAKAPPTYKTVAGAQKHCPSDTVVWVNTSSGIYHMPGTATYGTTKAGIYMCKADADSVGDKAAANGQ